MAGLSTPGALLAAAEGATSGFDLSQLITAGVTPAAVLLLLLTGKLYPSGIVETYRKRAEEAEADRAVLQGKMLDTVVPALTRSTDALTALAAQQQSAAQVPYPRPGPRPGGRPSPSW